MLQCWLSLVTNNRCYNTGNHVHCASSVLGCNILVFLCKKFKYIQVYLIKVLNLIMVEKSCLLIYVH